MNLFYGVVVAFLLTGVLGMATDRLVFKKLRNNGSNIISMMIASIGIGLVLRQTIQEIWGPNQVWYELKTQTYDVFGGAITDMQVYIIAISTTLIFILHFMFTKTKLGNSNSR